MTAGVAGPRSSEIHPGQSGFTLIEMIVVLVVLSLVTGIVMTRGPSHSTTLDVKQAVNMVAQTMRGARSRAIAAEHSENVEIDTIERTMRTGSAPAVQLPGAVTIAAAAPSGTTVRQRYVAIRFAPDGSSSGGGVVLTEGASRMLVLVDWLTGRVRFTDAL
jgi:general secretion pathway protein H